MTTRKEEILTAALKLLEAKPDGMRYSDLVNELREKLPHIPENTIHGNIWDIDKELSDQIYKPVKGLFRLMKFRDTEIGKPEKETKREKLSEEMFYEPFANWLKSEIEECNKAIPLGRNKFKDKWGTPDVIGIRESLRSDIIKAPTQIISAEIKFDSNNLITAFGQACAYRLFSHKTYIVVPKDSTEDDIARIDSLCVIFGIGLVLFDNTNANYPQFEIKVRPNKQEPDIFYVNKYLKLIEPELFG